MGVRSAVFAVALAIFPLTAAAAPPARPVEVLVVGTFHMSNPGLDLHNMRVDDVLSARRQAQIEAVVTALSRFRPTRVAVEWPAPIVADRYAKYAAGTLGPSRNEVVQLGFRLARKTGASVTGIDADGDFPYDAVKSYAEKHQLTGLLATEDAATDRFDRELEHLLATRGVSAALRRINDPIRLALSNSWYRTTLRVGSGNDQPGADLLTAWYGRNFRICANLLQLAQQGDRIVVFYGFGHALLLRQCVLETPGLKLVEPNAYLPR